MTIVIDSFIESASHYFALTLVHGTVLALITWLLSATILRRSRPAVHAFLWTIVLVKFLVPPILPGEMSLSGLITRSTDGLIVTQTGKLTATPSAIVEPDANGSNVSSAPNEATVRWSRWLASGYLVLVIVLSVRTIRSMKRAKRAVYALPRAPEYIQREVAALASRIGLKSLPDVRINDGEFTPYVFGFRRPVLAFPLRLIEQLEVSERRSLILHELAHIRRKDVAVRYLQGAAGILLFFFPPILWIGRRIEHFSEMACDQWAVAISRSEPANYAHVLVKVAREMSQTPQSYAGLSLIRRPQLLERRVRALIDYQLSSRPQLTGRAKLLLTCWSLFILMGGATARVAQQSVGADTKAEVRVIHDGRDLIIKTPENRKHTVRESVLQTRRRANTEKPSNAEELKETGTTSGVSQSTPSQPHQTLSQFEIGYLLGRRYAQEKAERRANASYAGEAEAQAKREIELRMQARNKQPPRY